MPRTRIEQHYTRAEVAALLKVSIRTVARWETDGKLRAVSLPGNDKRYSATAVDRILYPVPSRRAA